MIFCEDWTQEEAAERTHKHFLHSQHGLRGIVLPLLDQSRIWYFNYVYRNAAISRHASPRVVLIITGISVGFVGAWLDVLVAW